MLPDPKHVLPVGVHHAGEAARFERQEFDVVIIEHVHRLQRQRAT
eukprot:CAMPEP_0194385608 /NCGR_PEP_ID=MMETSP0174-20130528/81236_1 /TAXON_ID=216777 /ORGANISM="Proboscia alata, Strain PI-D3" /LENGTH=44 /DNA_ID= /DNA_START= /DNA_END= /DNA_ORIENTATION=